MARGLNHRIEEGKLAEKLHKCWEDVFESSDVLVEYSREGNDAVVLLGYYLSHIDAVGKIEKFAELSNQKLNLQYTSKEMMYSWLNAGSEFHRGKESSQLKYIPRL